MERSIGALSVAALLLTMMSPVARGLPKHDRGFRQRVARKTGEQPALSCKEGAIVGPIARGPGTGCGFRQWQQVVVMLLFREVPNPTEGGRAP